MSKIVWFQLNKLPSVDLLDIFCRGIKEQLSGSDEVVFFFTGATTPDEIDRFIKKLKPEAVNKDSFFISLGREHICSGAEEGEENIPSLEIKHIFDAYSRGQYGIDQNFSEQIRKAHMEKYFGQWNPFFPKSDLHHEETIHYYRCKDSVFALHINTTVLNKDLGYYIVDVDSLNKLMISERSKTSKFRIAFGRSALTYLYSREEQDRLVDSFIKNPDWLFYLCNNKNSGPEYVHRYPKERSLTAPKDFFYEIILSASETQYIAGYYDTQKDIGKAELFIYNSNLARWVRDANFAIGYNEAKGGTLYYPDFNSDIIKKCIRDEIGGIVNEFANCDSNEALHIRYLSLQNHESFSIYINCLLAIIDGAINSVNPGSWEVLKVPATDNEDDFNRYPTMVRDSTNRLFILCCSFDPEYNETTFKRQLDRLQQRYPSLCIFVLILYVDNTGRTLPPEHGTVPFHFSNDFELVFQLAINMRENSHYQNQLKFPGYMKNFLVFTNHSLQDFRYIPEDEQNISTTQEQKTNGGDSFDK